MSTRTLGEIGSTSAGALVQPRPDTLARWNHKIRSPLTALSGYLQLAERNLKRDASREKVVRYVGSALSAYRLCLGLLEQMFAQLEAEEQA